MSYFRAAMELAFRPPRADGSYRRKGGSDMGEDGAFRAWHRIQLGLDVVETCARDLDVRVCPRIVALRRQVDARLRSEPGHGSGSGEAEAVDLNEIVRRVQGVVGHLREILSAKGVEIAALANDRTSGSDALRAQVVERKRVLVEDAGKLFRVSNSMWDVLRSVG